MLKMIDDLRSSNLVMTFFESELWESEKAKIINPQNKVKNEQSFPESLKIQNLNEPKIQNNVYLQIENSY